MKYIHNRKLFFSSVGSLAWKLQIIHLNRRKLGAEKVQKLSYVSTTSGSIHEQSAVALTRVLRVDAGCCLGAQQILSARIQEPLQLCSVQFRRSVTSDFFQPHGRQHTTLPCPSPTPGACSNSCPSSRWCHPTISSSVVPFSSCPQSFPASGSFPVSQLFAWGGQHIGVSASTW